MKHQHMRKAEFDFHWPEPPLHIVLVHPEIPPNTGNVARLCAGTDSRLHLVEPMGFRLDDAKLRRAGLDYWDAISVEVHPDFAHCLAALPEGTNLHFFTTASGRKYTDAAYRPGDALIFGCETKGLPQAVLDAHAAECRGIPMQTDHVRSLNLSSAVAVVAYEALRQCDLAARGNAAANL